MTTPGSVTGLDVHAVLHQAWQSTLVGSSSLQQVRCWCGRDQLPSRFQADQQPKTTQETLSLQLHVVCSYFAATCSHFIMALKLCPVRTQFQGHVKFIGRRSSGSSWKEIKIMTLLTMCYSKCHQDVTKAESLFFFHLILVIQPGLFGFSYIHYFHYMFMLWNG